VSDIHQYETQIREIFKGLTHEYIECPTSRCITFSLSVQANENVDLPSRLDKLTELLHDHRITAVFAEHNGSRRVTGQFVFVKLYKDASFGAKEGDELTHTAIQLPVLRRIDLFEHIDAARKKVGHRRVTAKFFGKPGSRILMTIMVSSENVPGADHPYLVDPDLNPG